MSIITITSDFGTSDPYLAVIKGQLLSQLNTVQIIDISNNIDKFNIPQAAYIIKNSFTSFPSNTVHLALIGAYHPRVDFIIVKYENQYFLGQNNGLFSLVFENLPIIAYQITLSVPPENASFQEKSILVQAASHLIRGGVPEVIGEQIQGLAQMISYAPIIQEDAIRTSILYIDSYGNIITNLTKAVFVKNNRERNIEIKFRSSRVSIHKISSHYSNVDEGSLVALFNNSGYLEIAFNSGNAAQLLGLAITDTISIKFS